MLKLTARERTVLEERFGLGEDEAPKTLEQIGLAFGLSKERIRQIEAKALAKMREMIESEQLELSAP
jgi:RNA polymerase primary sigma factor